MKFIQILGTGCAKCERLAQNTATAANAAGIEFQLEKITDINRIMTFRVMMTPALVVDGDVKVMGNVPSIEEIKQMLVAGK